MVPVVIAGAALAEAAVAAVTAVSAAVAAASTVVVANALSEKMKEVEKVRTDTSAAVPGAKANCQYSNKINDLEAAIKAENKKNESLSKQYDELEKKIQESRKEYKKLENDNSENIRNYGRTHLDNEVDKIKAKDEEITNLLKEKNELNKKFSDSKLRNEELKKRLENAKEKKSK